MEPRPGVIRLYEEAREAGLKVAVCSAATKSSVILVLENLLGPERFKVRASALSPNASHVLQEIWFRRFGPMAATAAAVIAAFHICTMLP